jgi:hypothetical protein
MFFLEENDALQDEEVYWLKNATTTLKSFDKLIGGVSSTMLSYILRIKQPVNLEFVAICLGYNKYVKTLANPGSMNIEGYRLLQLFLLSQWTIPFHRPPQWNLSFPDMLRLLLQKGCSPNTQMRDSTVWITYLRRIFLGEHPTLCNHKPEGRNELIKAMLEYGADLDADCKIDDKSTVNVKTVLEKILGGDKLREFGIGLDQSPFRKGESSKTVKALTKKYKQRFWWNLLEERGYSFSVWQPSLDAYGSLWFSACGTKSNPLLYVICSLFFIKKTTLPFSLYFRRILLDGGLDTSEHIVTSFYILIYSRSSLLSIILQTLLPRVFLMIDWMVKLPTSGKVSSPSLFPLEQTNFVMKITTVS